MTTDLRLKPAPRLDWLMRTPMGRVIARPWLDAVSMAMIKRWYLPASRAWAAAQVAMGDYDHFLEITGIKPERVQSRKLIQMALDQVATQARSCAEADANWRTALFQGQDTETAIHAENERFAHWEKLNILRLAFMVMARWHNLPPCRYAIPSFDEVMAIQSPRLANPVLAFPNPAVPQVEQSVKLPSTLAGKPIQEYFLHFDAGHGTCWGRVFEPENAAHDTPTVIYLHGIMMELDMMRVPRGEIEGLVSLGLRVIALQGPAHGMRRVAGYYAGESIAATTPLGPVDYFAAHATELGALTRWLRAQGIRRIGWCGTSFGAFTSQLAASHASHWVQDAHGDALLLLTPSVGIAQIAYKGAFGRAFGLDKILGQEGWTEEMLDQFRPLTDPVGPPCMGGNGVFMVLGDKDDVAPKSGALGVAQSWGVPSEQITIRDQGHFSVPAGLMVDASPARAFAARLTGGN